MFCRGTRGTRSPATACLPFAQPLRRGEREKLEALRLKILYVKQQVDTYKPDFYIDQRILAADSQGNRYTFTEKAAGRSQTPKALSCFSRQLSPGMEITLSARVMGHYESQGVKYTRLGYVKYS